MPIKHTKKFFTFILICPFTFLSLIAFAQKPKKYRNSLPFDKFVRMGKLPNGLTFYIRHNENPKNKVFLNLINKVGSVLEDEDQRGLAHFMEHMEFNGTKHFPHNRLVDYLQKNGVRFGADINAYTSFDETVYQLPLPTKDPKILQNGLEIMRDWAHDALLDPSEIDKERGIVLEEKRLGKGAEERMRSQYWPVLLNDSRYSQRIPIGSETVIQNFKRSTIYRFYHDWYRPDLQAIIVVGDINVDKIEKQIRTVFGPLKNPVHERKRNNYSIPLDGKNHFIAVTDREMTSTVVSIIIKQPKLFVFTAADYRQSIIRKLYNIMIRKRFDEMARQANTPFVQGGAQIGGFFGNLDSFIASVTTKPGEIEEGIKAMWTEVERVRRFGFTQAELDRVKEDYQNQIESALKERNKNSSESYLREYKDHFLNGTASPGIKYEYQLANKELREISLADLNKITKTEIQSINRDVVILAPGKDKISLPDEATVNTWLKNVGNTVLIPYTDRTNVQSLLSLYPTAGKIIAENRDEKLNIITYTLNNSIKVVLKQTKYKDNEILFYSYAPGGTSLYNDDEYQSANFADVIPELGIGNYNPGELDKFLSGRQIEVTPYITERTQGVNGFTEPKDLEAALQLTFAYYTEPRKDSTMFHTVIERYKLALENRCNDPQSVFKDSVSATLYNYNARHTGPSVNKIDQVKFNRSYEIYKERFASASESIFTFVGNIDTTVFKPLIIKYLGALPATQLATKPRDLGIRIPRGRIIKNVYKGTEQKATVELFWSGTCEFSPENNLILNALKECLEIRLVERLREGESGVYSPRVYVQLDKYPANQYLFSVEFGCAPQNVDKLIASTLDEVKKIQLQGPTQVNLDKWRVGYQRENEMDMQTNEFWLGFLTKQQYNDESYHILDNFKKGVKQVTVKKVKDFAVSYLDESDFIRMVLLPEITNN